jgi:CxxC-x17-CxxC domain-containing protein
MAFEEKQLECADCGKSFVFSSSEQEFFATMGYAHPPKRCPECRNARRAGRSGGSDRAGGYGGARESFPAVCASCGVQTTVPFQPRTDRPVYCSDCYRKTRPQR